MPPKPWSAARTSTPRRSRRAGRRRAARRDLREREDEDEVEEELARRDAVLVIDSRDAHLARPYRPDAGHSAPLASFQAPVQLKLSALWIATMFVYVYVDILAFYKPGTVRDILEGRVWGSTSRRAGRSACLCS